MKEVDEEGGVIVDVFDAEKLTSSDICDEMTFLLLMLLLLLLLLNNNYYY